VIANDVRSCSTCRLQLAKSARVVDYRGMLNHPTGRIAINKPAVVFCLFQPRGGQW